MNVKPTQELWNKVENKIGAMFTKRKEFACKWENYGLPKSEIDTLCWRDICSEAEEAQMEALARMFDRTNALSVTILGERYDIDLHPQKLVAAKWIGGYGVNKHTTIKDPVILALANNRKAAMKAVVDEQIEFTKKVKDAYCAVPSINALIKSWPAVVELLPEDVIARVLMKVTRERPEVTAAKIDASAMSVHLLKAKVAK